MESLFTVNGITHNRTILSWPQANGQVERINDVIKKAIQCAVIEDHNCKHELDTFLLSYVNTSHCTTGKNLFLLLFSRVFRDKSPFVPGTVYGPRHDDAVKRNRAQKEKMKTCVDPKRRTKLTELKVGDDVKN